MGLIAHNDRALRWQGFEKQMFNNNKKMSKEINDEDLTVSPACTKPTVVGSTAKEQLESLNSIMLKFGEAHNLLAKTTLSKKEYNPISSLLSTAKIELFNFYIKIKEINE